MKIILTIGIVLSWMLFACNSNKSGSDLSHATNSDSLTFDTTSHRSTARNTCKDCPVFTAQIPWAKGPAAIADSINASIFNQVRNIFQVKEEPFRATTLPALLDSFANAYKEDQDAFPDRVVGWEGSVKGSLVYESENVVNIILDSYIMTGGAHGYAGKSSLIFDKNTGKQIIEDHLFKDPETVKNIAEEAFRKKYNIPAGQRLNDHGFMFDENTFILPKTFIFTNEGLLLYYNSYEIASYADGPKEVMISYDKLKDKLTVK